MDLLLLTNAVFAGIVFTAWSKDGLLNFSIKTLCLILMILNILRLVGKV